MVHPHQVQGKIYNFLPKSELNEMNINLDPNVTDIVRVHMVICLGIVRGRPDYVKVMTITSTLKEDHEYLPIAPVRKRPYPIQIKLRNNRGWGYYRGQQALWVTVLPRPSYLKIDEFYEVPIQALRNAVDEYGDPLSIPAKHHGGLAELNAYIARRDRVRAMEDQEVLFGAMDNLTLNSSTQDVD